MTISEREEMALVAILTTGMLIKLFIDADRPRAAENDLPWWVMDKRSIKATVPEGA